MEQPTIDEFTIKVLENIKSKFDDEMDYPGKYVKLEIDLMIEKMR